jgi:hypothetical protein
MRLIAPQGDGEEHGDEADDLEESPALPWPLPWKRPGVVILAKRRLEPPVPRIQQPGPARLINAFSSKVLTVCGPVSEGEETVV